MSAGVLRQGNFPIANVPFLHRHFKPVLQSANVEKIYAKISDVSSAID
jgi:hypothetical protein